MKEMEGIWPRPGNFSWSKILVVVQIRHLGGDPDLQNCPFRLQVKGLKGQNFVCVDEGKGLQGLG